MVETLHVRQIAPKDLPALVDLMEELGYSCTLDQLKHRFESMSDLDKLYLAEKGEEILGYIHAVPMARLSSDPFLEIVGLVVKQKVRNQGVGRALVEKVLSNPLKKVRVRCQTKRDDAHAFYRRLGFHEMKTQKVFETKNL